MTHHDDAELMLETLMDEHTPDRRLAVDRSHFDSVLDFIAATTPVEVARQVAADVRLTQLLTKRSRRINRLLRDIAESGTLPLDEFESFARYEVAIDGTERVALCAMTVRDWDAFASREQSAADRDHAKRLSSVAGAVWIAEQMLSHGAKSTRQLANRIARETA